MLLASPRHTALDRAAWDRQSAQDHAWATTSRSQRAVERAEAAVRAFASEPCYAGVSWGKDSVVLADLCARLAPACTLVWIRVGHYNPDCPAVRDAFLACHPRARYYEHTLPGPRRDRALLPDLGQYVEELGTRYLSGIRAQENRGRERFRAQYGETGVRFCAPLISWSADDVFAYLAQRALPVHPVYAMTMGGVLDRRWLRVSSLGGSKGLGRSRREWERHYYPQEMERLDG